MQIRGLRCDDGQPVELEIAAGRIASIRQLDARDTAGWPFLGPGLCDLQVNGAGGQEFSADHLTPEAVTTIARAMLAQGVTSFLPTITTASQATLEHAASTIARACDAFCDVGQIVAGVHIEGPHLSPEDGPRGAHPAEHCRPPSVAEFDAVQRAAGGRVRLVTLSPEYDDAPDFIAHVTATGVRAALGHMAATGRQIRSAVDAGARLSTHLGNGAHRTLPRHPNYVWDQLAEDGLWASLIVDGHHLPPEVVKVFLRAKTPGRCVLVSDLSGLAGLPPGRYASQLCELEILPDGRLVIAGQEQLLAGASRPLHCGVANVMRFAGLPLAEALALATDQPRRLLDLPRPGLTVGAPADLIAFDLPADLAQFDASRPPEVSPTSSRENVPTGAGLHIRGTVVAGQRVYGSCEG
jgi:N-acetylglucosamine-6-phosphate deacetylase